MYRFVSQYLTKRLYCILVIALLFVVFYLINTKNESIFQMYLVKTFSTEIPRANHFTISTTEKPFSDRIKNMKYILIWTNPRNSPLVYLDRGQFVFINKSCSWNNCYVTNDRNMLGDYTEFEVILFNGPELFHFRYISDLPKRRHARQKYVYTTIESAGTYPICSEFWNNFFNWTWSYRTASDVFWPYFIIKDRRNNVIGPKANMNWINLLSMDPIDDQLKASLASKSKAAAWFASNCDTVSLREHFVNQLEEQLQLYNLELDIYGHCGKKQCPKEIMGRCQKIIERHYYFYLAFENSISDDYVTEKLLHALNHNTVPIVFGGANYSRFMPHGIYLNAVELGPSKLALKMFELIQNPKAYYDYFRWKKYYSYHYTHENPDTDVYCRFCEYINNNSLMNKKSVYENLKLWWTPQRYCSNVISVKIH